MFAACGRSHFDPLVPPDAANNIVIVDEANLVFVSSRTITPGQASLATADALCTDDAHAAGLPGNYVAWLSSSSVNAASRLAGARGWRRPDGVAVADTIADIVSERMFAPPNRDVLGNHVSELVATATLIDGTAGITCETGTGNLTAGLTDATTARFTDYRDVAVACDAPSRVYCFGVSTSVAVSKPPPTAGKRIFVAEDFPGDGNLTVMEDPHCAAAAASAGLTGSFRAYLTDADVPAATKFPATVGPIVRIDGLVVATSIDALNAGELVTSANMTADGRVIAGPVWAGSPSPTTFTTSPDACQSWSTLNAFIFGYVGHLGSTSRGFFGTDERDVPVLLTCDALRPIYCLED